MGMDEPYDDEAFKRDLAWLETATDLSRIEAPTVAALV